MPGIFAAGPVWEQRIFENPVGPSCSLTKPLHPEEKKIARSPGKLGSKGNFQRQREKVWSIQGRAGHPRTWPGFCAKKSRKVYNSGQLAVFEWVLWVQPCTPYGPLGLVLYLKEPPREEPDDFVSNQLKIRGQRPSLWDFSVIFEGSSLEAILCVVRELIERWFFSASGKTWIFPVNECGFMRRNYLFNYLFICLNPCVVFAAAQLSP